MNLIFFPVDPLVWCEKGFKHFQISEYEKAIESFGRCSTNIPLKEKNRWVDCFFYRGMSHFHLGKLDEALEDFMMFN
jgi:tetratricopeptide (TPR) repeat protein